LARAQKLAAVGELGAGLAHSVNNPLTGIVSNVQLMLMDEEEGSENHETLLVVEKHAKQIGALVKELSTLADVNQGQHLQRIDLGQTVKEAVDQAKGLLRAASIEVSFDMEPDLPPIAGDTSSLKEAITNLVDNARLAMSEGGELTVSVESREDLLVGLKIKDTGKGMSNEERKRAFEPFYSSRAKAGAKGMGLARVHQVVENHKGQVTISSVVGEGTTVSVLLPAAQNRSLS